MSAAPLVEPQRCFVFRDQQTARAYRTLVLSQASSSVLATPVIELNLGTSVCYNGKTLTITLVGNTEILLKTENSETVELCKDDFEKYVRSGKITMLPSNESKLNSRSLDFIVKASVKDLKAANHRYNLLQQYFRGEPVENSIVTKRSLQYWQAKYRKAEQEYGYGYIGLLSFDSVKGNRNRKLPEHLLLLIDKFITDDYETHKQKRKSEVYGNFAKACSAEGISNEDIPSYKTFIKEIKLRSGFDLTKKREGRRAAYEQEPFYWELELTTPRHGDRPFEIALISYTTSTRLSVQRLERCVSFLQQNSDLSSLTLHRSESYPFRD